jgi:hypothetical protein
LAFARDCCAVLTDLSCVGIQAELCAHSRTINALVLHPSADIVRPATLSMFTHNTATVTRRPSRHQQCLIHRGTHTLALALLPLVRCMSHFVMEAHSAVTQCAALPSCRCPHALRRMNSGVAAASGWQCNADAACGHWCSWCYCCHVAGEQSLPLPLNIGHCVAFPWAVSSRFGRRLDCPLYTHASPA